MEYNVLPKSRNPCGRGPRIRENPTLFGRVLIRFPHVENTWWKRREWVSSMKFDEKFKLPSSDGATWSHQIGEEAMRDLVFRLDSHLVKPCCCCGEATRWFSSLIGAEAACSEECFRVIGLWELLSG